MKNVYFFLLLLSGFANAAPAIVTPTPLIACDGNADGHAVFQLDTKITEILDGASQATNSVTFYETMTDATNGVGDIGYTYANITPFSQIIYVRVEDTANGTVAYTDMELITHSINATITDFDSTVCGDSNMYVTFTGSGGVAPYTFTYIVNGGAPLTVVSMGNMVTIPVPTNTQGMFTYELISVTDGAPEPCTTQIFDTVTITITSGVTATQPPNMVVTEDPTDGVATFDLTTQTPIVIGAESNVTVFYYLSEADAAAAFSPISPGVASNFTGTNGQTIWVRLQSNLTGCYAITNFRLFVLDTDMVYIPDSALKLALVNANPTIGTAMDASLQNITVDVNADGEIQYSEALLVHYLSVQELDISSMTGIQAFTNLKKLHCSGNTIASLDVTALTNLEELLCGQNGMGMLNVAGLANLQLLDCSSNELQALSLSSCTNLVNIQADDNNLDSLAVSGLSNLITLNCNTNVLIGELDLTGLTSLEILDCRNNALSVLDVSGLINLVAINCNTNMLTSLDVSALTNLTTLACGSNQLTALDVSALTNLEILHCNDNQLTTLDCTANTSLTYLRCYANNMVTLFVKNGQDETFDPANWIENALEYICADESQLAELQTAVGTSIQVNSYCSFAPGGAYNSVAGTLRFDADNNGCNLTDIVAPLLKLTINDGTTQGATFTNASGNYLFYAGAGSYTVTPSIENSGLFTFSPANATATFPVVANSVSTHNFCVTANGVHPDVEVVIAPIDPARPGFNAIYKIVFKNKGNQMLSGSVTFDYNEALLDFVNAVPAADSQASGVLSFNYTNLMPFENRQIVVTLNVNAPTETPAVNINDILSFTAVANPVTGDDTVADNTFAFNQTVIGSYDPNDITCIEGDVVSPSEIGNYLHYVINFENTGTAPAENIVVKAVIDESQFDVASLQLLNNSHAVEARLNGNKVEFVFQGIYLETGGHGNILLKIKSDNGLVTGDVVSNKADIYFDYNFPVETLPAETVFQTLAVGNPAIDSSVVIYPNPSSGFVNIKASNAIQSVQVYDIQGRLLQVSMVNEVEAKIDLSGKQSGVYFLKVTSANGIKIEKIIKK